MHDPDTLIFGNGFIQIWHHDPETDGTDDSCGWFLRPRHLDQDVLKKIISRYESDWDRVFQADGSKYVYSCGLFHPGGDPHFSVIGITVQLFWLAAIECLSGKEGPGKWKHAGRYMQKNIWDIIRFAENPIDSLHDGITRKFETGCSEEYTPEKRNERIRSMAGCVYSYIMRDVRPWYRHPKWHIHHWRLNFPWWYRMFRKKDTCGESAMQETDW